MGGTSEQWERIESNGGRKYMNAMKFLLGALVALMVLGGMAMAATTVTSSITASKVLDEPNTATIGDFIVGDNAQGMDGVVVHDNQASWTLTAETNGGYNGKFWANGGAGPQLANQYSLGVATSNNQYWGSNYPDTVGPVTITDAIPGALATGVHSGDFPIHITFNQKVLGTDPVGAIQTVIVFTLA